MVAGSSSTSGSTEQGTTLVTFEVQSDEQQTANLKDIRDTNVFTEEIQKYLVLYDKFSTDFKNKYKEAECLGSYSKDFQFNC